MMTSSLEKWVGGVDFPVPVRVGYVKMTLAQMTASFEVTPYFNTQSVGLESHRGQRPQQCFICEADIISVACWATLNSFYTLFAGSTNELHIHSVLGIIRTGQASLSASPGESQWRGG